MEFRILGPIEVLDGPDRIAIRRGKEQALLAYLLLHANEVVPTSRLIDVLWDERPPPTAAKILQNAVSHLRRALGEGRLLTRDPGYVFEVREDELDLQRFERLAREGRAAEALTLWRGAPLLELGDERFADDARRRLEELRLAVLEDRIEADLASGRHVELVPELEQLVADHPLRERLHGQLMRALYASGRQGESLEAYRRARRTLSEELGLEPGPQLQELERRILNHDPALVPPPAPPRRSAQLRGPERRRSSPRWAPVAILGVLLLAGVVVGTVLATGGDGKPLVATKNSLAVIDPARKRVVGVVPVGNIPRGVTVGAGRVWVGNAGEGTVSEIDAKDLHLVQTIGLGAAATDLVEADGQIWVVTGSDDTVVRIDARSGGVLGTLRFRGDPQASAYTIAKGSGSVWVGSGNNVYKFDPQTHDLLARSHYGGGINGLAVSAASVWAVSSNETVGRLSAATLHWTGETPLGVIPTEVAIGGGSVWVVAPAPVGSYAAVWRLDPVTARVIQTTRIGRVRSYPPTLDVAFGEGALWVASYERGTVTRLAPGSGTVTATIHVGGHPSGITVGAGRVWVTVG